MTTPSGARIFYVLAILAFAILLPACEKPIIATVGEAAVAGGLSFEVQDYSVRYLELSDDGNTYEYPRPVLIIPVRMENVGEDDFIYNPTAKAPQMTEGSTPLLYPDPGVEADLAKHLKVPVNGVFLEKGTLAEQLTERRTLKPGESLVDVFLFEVPAEATATNFIFSIPPIMHRGELPVLFRMPYQARKPEGPPVHELGDAIATASAEFRIDTAEITYVKITDRNQGPGYSTEPLFKVSYTVTNTSDEAILYNPGHRDLSGRRGAALYSSSREFNRVRFPANSTVEGQTEGSVNIAPGQSVKDFVLFEVPDKEVTAVMLEVPARIFDGAGLIRVNLPFKFQEIEQPKEMKSPKVAEKNEP